MTKDQDVVGLDAFSRVTEGLYAAAACELDWSEALGRVAGIVASPAATLSFQNPLKRESRVVVGEFGTDPAYSKSYSTTYGAMSSFGVTLMMFHEGTVGRIFDYQGRDKILQGRFYKEWCAPQGYNDFLGALLIREPELISVVGFVRLVDQPLFDEADERKLSLFVPHIIRAFRSSAALDTLCAQRRDLMQAIDALPTPVITLDRQLRVLNINRAAIDQSMDGGPLCARDGKLAFVDEAANRILVNAFRNVPVASCSISLGKTFSITATLIPYADPSRRTAAILTMCPAHEAMIPPGLALEQAFGFTNAELRTLVMLLEGGTRETVATDLGVSLATVKTHIQGLFAKTQTNRQADLVRVVMGG
jgi:DNA-binding CsgD family transcriptional regulator/PAS domain-containing protein